MGDRRRRRGFTLMELLVVVGIIIILTALSIPAISKFLGGRSLLESGRVVQSAFADARRAAIAQRTSQYLVFFREPDDKRPGEFNYGMRRYRRGVDPAIDDGGYEGDAHYLLPGTQFEIDPTTTGKDDAVFACLLGGAKTTVFEGLPGETQTGVFNADRQPEPADGLAGTLRWMEFMRDGTLRLSGSGATDLVPPAHGGGHIFDLAVDVTDFEEADFDALPGQVDMSLRGAVSLDERCFIDLGQTTGRARVRVIKLTGIGDL